jgi:hypothetical protein
VVGPVGVGTEQGDEPVREVNAGGRGAELVVDDAHLVAVAREPQHRVDEVASAEPEETGGADDEVGRVRLGGRALPLELRRPVGRERRRRVRLHVGLPLAPVEDVVARNVEDGGAELGRGSGEDAGARAR